MADAPPTRPLSARRPSMREAGNDPLSASLATSPIQPPRPTSARSASGIHAPRPVSAGQGRPPGSRGNTQPSRGNTQSPSSMSPASSIGSLPYRPSTGSLSTLLTNTRDSSLGLLSSLTERSPRGSGGSTPTGPGAVLGSTLTSTINPSASASLPSDAFQASHPSHPALPPDPRTTLLRSFAPHIAVLASEDTQALLARKGLRGGLLQLIRPFGERVPGRVTIRDSVGASRAWADFGVRFVGLGERGGGGDVRGVEEEVERAVQGLEARGEGDDGGALWNAFLRRVLREQPLGPAETFAHPVACVVAISSGNGAPIESLRRLYAATNEGQRVPAWVDNEYLRYYVLVHDEDGHDIAKSTALYEQMKRHFGLHCHLLRVRSAVCVASDDDGVPLPSCEWGGDEGVDDDEGDEDSPPPYIFESDITALSTFIRSLITQSLLPSMERNTAIWNEQIATRRRGLSGRLMSLSKRWNPLASTARAGSPAPTTSNYDPATGYYKPGSPEALMRRLADWAFLLRDFKLAGSVYELVRADAEADRAWAHLGAACEMSAVCTLLLNTPTTATSTPSSTTTPNAPFEPLVTSLLFSAKKSPALAALPRTLETALHTYTQRTGTPLSALRTILLTSELLATRPDASADEAPLLLARALEMGLGSVGGALVAERVAGMYAARPGMGAGLGGETGLGGKGLGMRKRKGGFWAWRAAEGWVALGVVGRGVEMLRALEGYGVEWEGIVEGLEGLRLKLGDGEMEEGEGEEGEVEVEVSQALQIGHRRGRSRAGVGVGAAVGVTEVERGVGEGEGFE
ncbi:hypothetical protein EJ06DRAFT_585770 [Trichodelitschia bisporula]|uniref:TRAPP complex protein TRS85 n=1 Tax=Trichodelitschia bisporula TaxID=703511 RepID=A0A6G1HI05_9PEZI|nr:hypothetical protein EJ06DRAFT_585770 [Trichodelitschia bisporula]